MRSHSDKQANKRGKQVMRYPNRQVMAHRSSLNRGLTDIKTEVALKLMSEVAKVANWHELDTWASQMA